ncbi:MAG: hypothetical protein CVU50_04425 [Candidatus Cloacimonetes bacterium HGW-Cloacimonetes-3]|jgi:poly-gamma-glutamate capsule biosynthesis protein CapA/YwtB (metallophosphatase superfamily)|nr:MAG: hypothetical protein CVU50_04425 [Candidatus Cloacimonetes bacterium HGW-Cloacimonetes-3]
MFKVILMIILLALTWMNAVFAARLTPIENFDSGEVILSSWATEDINPDSWSMDTNTPDGSAYCLKLYGNMWKYQEINPHAVDSVGIIQLKVKTSSGGRIQGIGFTDGVNQLFYSFAGTAILDLETWIPVYQGAMTSGVWNAYLLPLASDWQAFFEYLPTITGLIYVNDSDGTSNKTMYIDAIEDISSDIPVAPQVSIIAGVPVYAKQVGISFESVVFDPDSSIFSYEWTFGDSTTSVEANPMHWFTCYDAHSYTVSLKVRDDTGKYGYASTDVTVDPGPSSLPLTMNFVGDVMLARAYESGGGIIQTQGVNAIFAPTKPIYGDVADVSVANLEVVLSNMGTPHPTKSVIFRGNPANISGLVYAGIDVVSTANNHTLDYGVLALQQMRGLLDSNGIIHSGSGVNTYDAYQPAFINQKGLNIAFLRSSDRTGQYNNAQPYLQAGYDKPGFAYMTPYYIQQQLEAVESVADLKIVEMHGGSEYSLSPGSGYDKGNPFALDLEDEDYNYRSDVPHQWDIDIRHSAIDSGADLVIVHHPHIIQGLEVYNNKLIAHSLGNFVFDLDYPETMPSMILYADAYEDRFDNFSIKPVFIDGYIPKPATGELGLHILDYLAMRSRELNTRLWVDKNSMQARVLMEDDNPSICTSPCSIYKSLDSHVPGFNQTAPINLPRMGSISDITSIEPAGNAQIRLGAEKIWYGNFEDEGSSFWAPPLYSSTEFVDGSKSAWLSVVGSGSVTSTIPKRTKIYDNSRKYSLHGWIKTENSGGSTITIRYFSARTSGSALSSENICIPITGTNDWAFFHQEITIPSNGYYYDIRLSHIGSYGVSNSWFDNVGLIEWTSWADPWDLSNIPWPNNYYWIQARSLLDMKSLCISFNEKSFYNTPPEIIAPLGTPIPSLSVYPNPFNPTTTISCYLPIAGNVSVEVYNIKGQLVKKLIHGYLNIGNHQFIWDSEDDNNRKVSSGIYFLRIQSGKHCVVKKMVLMK